MAESLAVDALASKEERYQSLIPQVKALVSVETDRVANLANIAAALRQAMGFFWVGFYLDSGKDLVLGPFQGPVACTRIPYSKGVCGASFSQKKTLVVADVDQFPGHIACSSDSKSEIVLPVVKDGRLLGVLDIDSDQLASFDHTDQQYLELLLAEVAAHL